MKKHHVSLHPAGPPIFPLSERLSETPIYLMMQTLHTSMSYRAAIGSLTHESPVQHPIHPDLRFPHYAALTILDEMGPISQKELSQRLRFDASDLVTIVDDLEAAGLVERERDEKDRRRYRLHILPTAKKTLAQRHADALAMSEMFFAALTPQEQKQLREMLQRLDEYHREHFMENAQMMAQKLRD
jgi:DNA-binding MarR family transcriptional regulator